MNLSDLFSKKTEPAKVTRRMKKVAIELMRQSESMSRQGLADWRSAWQQAINVINPDRRRLYQIYRDASIDLHLSGCIGQRTGAALSRSFKLVDRKGKTADEATELLNSAWFKDFLRLALESVFWGYSLIELGELTTLADGRPAYSSARIVPRSHVLPHVRKIARSEGDTDGIDYTQPPYSPWIVEVGSPDSLGLLLKAATQTIPKKQALACWDAFAEMFGMPMRVAKTSTRSDDETRRLEEAMETFGAKAWAVVTDGTEIEFVESSRTDAYNVYDRRAERADKELSKLVIGQTMTIEDGSSLSQSETHLKVFQTIVESDCDMLRDVINTQLLPRMKAHGFNVEGLSFEWDYAIDYTPEQQLAYETMIADRYDVDPTYFAEKYNMPVGERRGTSSPMGEQHSKLATPFFD